MKLFKNCTIKLVLITVVVGIIAVGNFATGNEAAEPETSDEGVQITVLYDNYTLTEGCRADWGFSCIVTGTEKCILFDTGTRGNILLDNIERLQAPTQDVELVAISHNHYDHTGGLLTFLGTNNNVSVYLPPSVPSSDISNIEATGASTQVVNEQMQLCECVHLTGPLGNNIIEQAMVLETPKGLVVITGCAHPGVDALMAAVANLGAVRAVLGGFHGFSNLSALEGIPFLAPCHCTQHTQEIADKFPDSYVEIMAGTDLEF